MAPGQLRSLIGSIRRKPTSAPDRRDDNDPLVNGAGEKKTSVAHDLIHGGHKTRATVAEALTTLASGEPMDDKKLMLEHGVAMLQSLPLNSGLSEKVSDGFIQMLWNDLPHPSATIAGPTARYRRHDGGNNNIWSPEMGKAGTPYARNVPPLRPKGPNLPDPELVFEQLLKREEGTFREHPSGLNRMFFSFATVVIHECFQTSRSDPWINETSSYVDLSTLYGNTEKEQKRVRTYSDGRIHPDSIASERIMLMPPGVIATLLLFSRNHNHIAESLLSINEDGKYREWDHLDDKGKEWQDNDIFQIARNINVGFFATVVLKDYVAAILNTPRADSTWSLDLGKEIKSGASRVDRANGNVVSVEFAVLYHWHAALSAADASWMEELLRWNLPDLKSLDDMTPELFYEVVKKEGHKLMTTPPKDWTFNNLKRGPDGHFNNAELAELIKDCIEEPAHAFGPHGTPSSLKVVDIMGQLQAREMFNVCTMNEFRKYLNLKPYESFEDWCEDGPTARAAELLYGHVDNLELYPGLMAECTKPAIPGSGVCPGQTTGRGILDDAVALVRGDRFLSYDLTSNTLTNWGVSKLADIPPGAYGGMLPKLIFRGLPGSFPGTSSYALLPFYTPKAVNGILKGNKVVEKYDITRPASDLHIVAIETKQGCHEVFEDRDGFLEPEQKVVKNVTGGNELLLNGTPRTHLDRSEYLREIFFEENFETNVRKFFQDITRKQIASCALKYRGTRRSLDVVRDVTNVVPILWLAERFAIPMKTAESPRGLFSTARLFDYFTVLFQYLTFNILPENEWGLRDQSAQFTEVLRKIIETHLKTQQGFKEKIVDRFAKDTAYEVGPVADRLYHALIATKQPVMDVAGDCVGLSAPIAGTLTQQAALLVDLYLSEGYEQYKARITELAQQDGPAVDRELEGFVYEGMRHAGVLPGLHRVAAKDATIQDGSRGFVNVKAGQHVLLATAKAAMDSTAFPNPETLNPHRNIKDYTLLGHGLHYVFGERLVGPALATTLKEVFRLKNLRRAEGRRGRFSIVEQDIAGVKLRKYLDSNSRESAFPTTLTVEYDE